VFGQDEQKPRKERGSRVSRSEALAAERHQVSEIMDVDVRTYDDAEEEVLSVDEMPPPLELDSIIFTEPTAPGPDDAELYVTWSNI